MRYINDCSYYLIDERLARAVLEPTEITAAQTIFTQLQSIVTPAEQVDHILRFAVSQNVRSWYIVFIDDSDVACTSPSIDRSISSCGR